MRFRKVDYKTFSAALAAFFSLTMSITAYSFGTDNKPLQVVSFSLMTSVIILLCKESKLVKPPTAKLK